MRIRRQVVALVSALALAVLAAPAWAQEPDTTSWPLEYISYYSNIGAHVPNIQEPTTIRLHGWLPYGCGGVRRDAVIDPGHITLALRKLSEIGCDTVSTWHADFYLGYLPKGDHRVTVTRTFVNAAATDSITETASFSFPVIDLNQEPLPEPPPGTIPNWVVPYVAYGYTLPSQPNAQEPTSVVLHGLFPYDCGVIVNAFSDSTGLSFTMAPGGSCNDTARTWTQSFPLGKLSPGHHTIMIARRLMWPDSTVTVYGEWGFDVWADANTPLPQPPGPPDQPSFMARCLSGWTTHAPPTIHDPVWLSLWGWFPYYCGEVVDYQILDPHRVTLRLRPRATSCGTDTSAVWAVAFNLGLLPPGPYDMEVIMFVESDPKDAVVERHANFQIMVDDREVSASMPNPFVDDTQFMVSSGKSEDVDVGIYDLHGRRVTTLFKGKLTGPQTFRWDGKREDGSRAGIGIYFSRVAFSNRVVTRKLVMLPR